MTRDEAIDLLQVMHLDEREPPGLAPKGLTVRVEHPGRDGSHTHTGNADAGTKRSPRMFDEPNLQDASLPVSVLWSSVRL